MKEFTAILRSVFKIDRSSVIMKSIINVRKIKDTYKMNYIVKYEYHKSRN